MAKTNAENQRAYRERKKQKDSQYLAKERARVKDYRTPIDQMPRKKKKAVRKRNKLYSKAYRDRIKKQAQAQAQAQAQDDSFVEVEAIDAETDHVDTVSSSTDAPRQSRSRPCPLLVKLTFPNKRRQPKRSIALKIANAKINYLTKQLSSSKRMQQKWKKRYQRTSGAKYATHKQTNHSGTDKSSDQTIDHLQQQSEITPSTKTRNNLRESGVSPSQLPTTVVRQLTMANVLFHEIKESVAFNNRQSKKNVMTSLVGGKVLKKYRCVSGVYNATGLSRRGLFQTNSKVIEIKGRARLTLLREQLKRQVVSFMERDDISICMPGKADAKSLNGMKHQTRIMNDYLSEVYAKFQIENQHITLSFASFCKLRPGYILLTSHISRNTCLCKKHQNMAMKLKCLRSVGLQIPKSPEITYDSVIMDAMDQLLDNIEGDVEYDEWKRVNVEGKMKMKVVKITKNATDFKNYMLLEYAEFRDHVGRVKSQYAALHQLKKTLPDGHIIIQMDFAENFTCSSLDEIQSAYWNATNVTLHPVVAYYRSDKLEHKNFIYVSDVNQHNSTAVLAILKLMLPELKTTFPDATHVHYWTDSPSSQYRNRYMFDIILKHKELFGLEARWNYFECGHGKGPCDGLGGACKRQASDAVKQGKATIQDAQDFYEWARQNQKSIQYRFYSTTEIEQAAKDISMSNAKVVHGTMKLHAVMQQNGVLFSRTVSCYCTGCLSGNELCDDWRQTISQETHTLQPRHASVPVVPVVPVASVATVAPQVPVVGRFFAAIYEGNWFIGKVVEVDIEESDTKITFMEKTRGKGKTCTYKWPSRPDEIWVAFDDVLCFIDAPVAIGKTERQYNIAANDVARIEKAFK